MTDGVLVTATASPHALCVPPDLQVHYIIRFGARQGFEFFPARYRPGWHVPTQRRQPQRDQMQLATFGKYHRTVVDSTGELGRAATSCAPCHLSFARRRIVDDIDRELVEALRSNARSTYAELARRVGLTAPSAHERVAKLESSGVITGYHAAVAPSALGLGVSALI